MAGKKTGRIAVPYIITILISLIIIGGAAFFIYNYFELGSEDELPELVGGTTEEITYDDSHTILLILETPDDESTLSFALMRSVPSEKALMFVGIPTNTIGTYEGKQTQIKSVYETGGASVAMDFLETLFDVDINKYMIFNTDSLLEICDIFGGVTYAPDVDISGLGSAGEERIMNGKQIERYITYSFYPDGEMQRAFNTGSILAAMVNQSDGQRLSDNLDMYFNTVINMTDSNITAVDYKQYSSAIKYMLEKGTAIAKYSYMTGTTSNENFYPDSDFFVSLKEEFFTAPEPETTASESESESLE